MKGRKFWSLLLSVMLIGLLAACGTTETATKDKNDSAEHQHHEKTASKTQEASNSETKATAENMNDKTASSDENGASNETSTNGTSTDKKEQDVMTKDVTYTGLADPHTIEVKDGEEYMTLQIDPDTANEWENISENTVVTIHYYQNENGQNVLVHYTVKK